MGSEHNVPTTHQLVGLAKDGDRRALNDLMDRYLPRVLRVVRLKRGTFLSQRLEDQDLAQEVLIRVWRSLGQYDPKQTASFLLWVTKVAENALRDLARRQRAKKRNPGSILSLEEEKERGVPDRATHPMETATPSRIVSRVERSGLLDASVASLSPEAQNLLIFRFYYDLPLEEVGRAFKLGPEAARSRIRRALSRLRTVLESRGVEGADQPDELIRQSF